MIADSLRQRQRHPAAEGTHSLPAEVIETTNTLVVVVNAMADQPSFLSCLGHFSYPHRVSPHSFSAPQSRYTHTAVLMRVPVGRRKKKKTRFTCCIWMSHYNMQMGDDEPKRARAEKNKIKKKANNLLRRWIEEERAFSPAALSQIPETTTRSKGEEEDEEEERLLSYMCTGERREELLIFLRNVSIFSPVYLVSPVSSPQQSQQQHKPTIYTTGTIDYTSTHRDGGAK